LSAQTILKQAADFGVKLTLDGDQIAFKAPRKVPPALLANIKEHKAEIIAILRSNPAIEHEAVLVAAELTAMNAIKTRFQAELALLRADNARGYSSRTPWQVKW
jgi:TubC N-terminal docking domain